MLRSVFGPFLLCAVAAGPAWACPGLDPAAEPLIARVRMGAGLSYFMPFTMTSVSGGAWNLRDCGLEGEGLAGYDGDALVAVRPDVVIHWLAGPPHLSVRVENEADTNLLIRDPAGGWHFNEDARGHDPMIVIEDPAAGDYVVWLGARGTMRFTGAGTLTIDGAAP